MPTIKTLVLRNFKRFDFLELKFRPDLNIVLGDNEAGKSSLLLALDLVLSASRSKVESLGLESLLHQKAVDTFMAGQRTVSNLPTLSVQLYLTESYDPEFNGKYNSDESECDGLRMDCAVPDEYLKEVTELLQDSESPFPFEYYVTSFSTFAGVPHPRYKKHVKHLLLDSSRIDTEYAAREYTRALYSINTHARDRNRLESYYRRSKDTFRTERLTDLNAKIADYEFSVRTSAKSNLENDLVILEHNMPLDNRGKGRQCLVKTEFALSKGAGDKLDVLLIEEPENHLSHTSTRRLLDKLSKPDGRQVVIATHSSLICSRLDLRKALLLGVLPEAHAVLRELPPDTAEFFMKAPDNNVLEFALAQKVILVEGDAEYILIDALYAKHAEGATLDEDGVHVISVGGTSFKRYLDLAKLLKVRTAVIRDNDGDFMKNCVESYESYRMNNACVFSEADNSRSTFEICLYHDNKDACEKHLGPARKSRSVLEYMLAEKADAAFQLLTKAKADLVAPAYIQQAITWIRA